MKTVIASMILGSAISSYAQASQEYVPPCIEKENQVLEQTAPEQVTQITAFTPAETVKRVNPEYPRAAAKSGKEGWVKMSYVIDETGRVKDPIVDDFGGDRRFVRKAVSALERWTFNPAMKDGKPTQQCEQQIQFDFVLDQKPGARREFIKRYKNIDTLLNNGELEAATLALNELHEKTEANRYENAWLYSLDARLANELDQPRRERQSLYRTIASSRTHKEGSASFNDEYMAYMYQRLFILNANFGYYSEALQAVDELKAFPGQEERGAQLSNYAEKLTSHIDSKDNIQVSMQIGENGHAFHTLVRNSFAFVDINDDIDTVEVRCNTHREKFTVAEQHIWSIPASWGQCRVLVKGRENASFNLVEIANVDANT